MAKFEEYPKAIRVGDTSITVKSAEEEATWRASQAPPKAAPAAPAPVKAAASHPPPFTPPAFVEKPVRAVEHEGPTHTRKGDKKK